MLAVRFAVASLGVLSSAAQADALSCWRSPTCEAFAAGATVFSGRVIAVQAAPAGAPAAQAVRLAVEQPPFSALGREVVVYSKPPSSGGDTPFVVGRNYVVHAAATKNGLVAGDCSTLDVAAVPDDLAFLKTLAGPARGGHIYGRVIRVEDHRLLPASENRPKPIAGAPVGVSGRLSREVTTGADGRFDIRDLPPGTYELALKAPPGLALSPFHPEIRQYTPTTITIAKAFDCHASGFVVSTDSRITGVLHGSSGTPVVDRTVDLIALPTDSAVAGDLWVTTRTNRQGRYEFSLVPPGRYLVATKERRYHPGVTARSQATVVMVGEGSRVQLAPMRVGTTP